MKKKTRIIVAISIVLSVVAMVYLGLLEDYLVNNDNYENDKPRGYEPLNIFIVNKSSQNHTVNITVTDEFGNLVFNIDTHVPIEPSIDYIQIFRNITDVPGKYKITATFNNETTRSIDAYIGKWWLSSIEISIFDTGIHIAQHVIG